MDASNVSEESLNDNMIISNMFFCCFLETMLNTNRFSLRVHKVLLDAMCACATKT